MADRLTQLQDCLDQLATQFYASIRYISMHHPSSALAPNQPLPPASPPPPEATPSQPTTNTASQGVSSSAQNINTNNITNNNIQLVAQPALTPISNPPASNPPTVPPEAIASSAAAPPSQNQASDPAAADQPSTSVEIPLAEATAELAHDLLIKTRQIAHLVSVLPGVEKSEEEQGERIRALEKELREAELERVEAVREMEGWRERLEVVIGGVRR